MGVAAKMGYYRELRKRKEKSPEEIREQDELDFPEILAFVDSEFWRYRDWVETRNWIPLNGKNKIFRNFR